MDVMNAENAGAFFCPALLSHKNVVAAIAPCNLAAFPPSLEVNAENAGAIICLSPASVQSFVPSWLFFTFTVSNAKTYWTINIESKPATDQLKSNFI
jgi:hypothetical protein